MTNPPIKHARCLSCRVIYDYTAETNEFKECGVGKERKELKTDGGILLPESYGEGE